MVLNQFNIRFLGGLAFHFIGRPGKAGISHHYQHKKNRQSHHFIGTFYFSDGLSLAFVAIEDLHGAEFLSKLELSQPGT
jgi:hypothetical protein